MIVAEVKQNATLAIASVIENHIELVLGIFANLFYHRRFHSDYPYIDARIEQLRNVLTAQEYDEDTYTRLKDSKQSIVNHALYAANAGMRVGRSIRKGFRECGFNVPDETLSNLGEEASRLIFPDWWNAAITTRDIWWRNGDFGDYGSCYWGDNFAARDMLENDDRFQAFLVYHIERDDLKEDWKNIVTRFYQDADTPLREKQRGCLGWLNANAYSVGRAWTMEDYGGYYVFNGYAKQHWDDGRVTNYDDNVTAKMAGALVSALNQQVELVAPDKPKFQAQYTYISNDGDTDGVLYINSGTGYYVSQNIKVGKDYSIDFLIEDERTWCPHCEEYRDAEFYDVHITGRWSSTEMWCEDCVENDALVCDDCNEYAYGSSYELVRPNGRVTVCQVCFENMSVEQCWHCGSDVEYKDTTPVQIEQCSHDVLVCPDCEEDFPVCSKCRCTVDETDDNGHCYTCGEHKGE